MTLKFIDSLTTQITSSYVFHNLLFFCGNFSLNSVIPLSFAMPFSPAHSTVKIYEEKLSQFFPYINSRISENHHGICTMADTGDTSSMQCDKSFLLPV
jgi:hypothetical protein